MGVLLRVKPDGSRWSLRARWHDKCQVTRGWRKIITLTAMGIRPRSALFRCSFQEVPVSGAVWHRAASMSPRKGQARVACPQSLIATRSYDGKEMR